MALFWFIAPPQVLFLPSPQTKCFEDVFNNIARSTQINLCYELFRFLRELRSIRLAPQEGGNIQKIFFALGLGKTVAGMNIAESRLARFRWLGRRLGRGG